MSKQQITEEHISRRVEVNRLSGGIITGVVTGMFDGDSERCWVKFDDDNNQHICSKSDLVLIGDCNG